MYSDPTQRTQPLFSHSEQIVAQIDRAFPTAPSPSAAEPPSSFLPPCYVCHFRDPSVRPPPPRTRTRRFVLLPSPPPERKMDPEIFSPPMRRCRLGSLVFRRRKHIRAVTQALSVFFIDEFPAYFQVLGYSDIVGNEHALQLVCCSIVHLDRSRLSKRKHAAN